jgi:hypothetical protein
MGRVQAFASGLSFALLISAYWEGRGISWAHLVLFVGFGMAALLARARG